MCAIGLVAALCVGCAADAGENLPLFRAGLLSDTHVGRTAESCAQVAKAMRLFAREHVDVICHLGDLADVYAPEGFAEYRKTIDAAFGEKTPLTLYAFGGHDRNGYELQPGETDRNECGWRTMREKLKIPHARYDTVVFGGCPFVVISEYFPENVAEKMVAEAVAAHPGLPVFVLEHEPAYDTVYDSVAWGNASIRRVCDKYPQVIHLSGHTHGSNRNELNIWQGGFTEVNVGCLQVWAGEEANTCRSERRNSDDGVLVMDVFRDKVVFRRFSLTTGEEWRGDAPWTVPLPFDPKTPFGRDIVKEFVEAFRAEGLGVGLYYSLKDWEHPDFTIDCVHPKRPAGKGLQGTYAPDSEFDKLNVGRDMAHYRQYMKDQTRELLTNYGKIDIIWFDYSYPHANDRQGKGRDDWDSVGLLRLARSLQPDIIVDDRLDLKDTEDGWDFVSPEAKKVPAWPTRNGVRVPWETCHAFASFFCYHRDETGYKTPSQLIDLLVDSVSKGGNFLLNVSPNGRGEIDGRALERLEAIGEWMRGNAASVYGCTAAPDDLPPPPYTVMTWNPVRRRLYLHLMNYPYKRLPVAFADRIAYAQFLHDGSEIKVLKDELEIPVEKPKVTIPVIEVVMDVK